MQNKKIFLIVIFVLSVSYSFAQTKPLTPQRPTSIATPGNIKLLPEYTHEAGRGIDSAVGSISKKDGLTIRYDIGGMAGNYTESRVANNKENIVWQKRQKVNDDDLLIAYFKDGQIMASYFKASANFLAKTNSQEDIVDFLVMVMTYNSGETLSNQKLIK